MPGFSSSSGRRPTTRLSSATIAAAAATAEPTRRGRKRQRGILGTSVVFAGVAFLLLYSSSSNVIISERNGFVVDDQTTTTAINSGYNSNNMLVIDHHNGRQINDTAIAASGTRSSGDTAIAENRMRQRERSATGSDRGVRPGGSQPARRIVDNSHNTASMIPVLADDLIYKSKRLAPVVLTKYKLVFFDVPKVASSAFMILFQRMEGVDRSKLQHPKRVHHPKHNGLRYLYQFSLENATRMMNDPTWTRATFVRNPHERLLSAYFDKGIGTQFKWIRSSCCKRTKDCMTPDRRRFRDFVDLAIGNCRNDHWFPQSQRVDDKFWPLVNFVGRMDALQQDAEALLRRVRAWDEYGATGWGSSGNDPVFQPDAADGRGHASRVSTRSQISTYYFYDDINDSTSGYPNRKKKKFSRDLYDNVYKYYEADYNHPVLGLQKKTTST